MSIVGTRPPLISETNLYEPRHKVKTPLKKNRAFSRIELFMTDSEYTRIKKMKNLIETLNRPEEHMTIYRTDGSFVSLKYENSQVTICDSREKNVRRVVEADNFIRDIMRE